MSDMRGFGKAGLSDAASAIEDAKAFNKGKGRLLAAMVSMVVAALGAFAFYLVQDQPNPYAELGKQVNGLRSSHFDQFWTCALPNAQPGEIKNNAELMEELHSRGAAGARYGAHLQNKCVSPLRELSTRLRAMLPPPDAAASIENMSDATSKIEVGVNTYAAYLQSLEGPYNRDSVEPQLEKLVRGWYEFRKAHSELNALVKSKLGL